MQVIIKIDDTTQAQYIQRVFERIAKMTGEAADKATSVDETLILSEEQCFLEGIAKQLKDQLEVRQAAKQNLGLE